MRIKNKHRKSEAPNNRGGLWAFPNAILEGNPEEIKKKSLADLMLHLVFYAKIGSEEGQTSMY